MSKHLLHESDGNPPIFSAFQKERHAAIAHVGAGPRACPNGAWATTGWPFI